jgi:molecular chaperone GrpE
VEEAGPGAGETADAVEQDGGAGRGEADPLTRALAERDEYLDSLRRLQAEFENYRKRVVAQQADQLARAMAGLVDKLLPVLDALDLGAQHLGDADSPDAKALVAAGSLLHGVLAKEGLEKVDPTDEPFDPTAHEAVSHVPAGDDDPSDDGGPVVVAVMRPGYRWKGTVVRPAMVTVRG